MRSGTKLLSKERGILRSKIVVRFLEEGIPQKQEFDNIDEALNFYNQITENEYIRMADLEMETVTTIKSIRR